MQIIDNERLRGWRLALKPGETTPAFTQNAPGVRIVVEGGELIEIDAEGAGQNMALQPGDFQWRDAGPARALRNAGATTIEIVEFEVK
jgi:quercetin dioxygenase-like cupin family protein